MFTDETTDKSMLFTVLRNTKKWMRDRVVYGGKLRCQQSVVKVIGLPKSHRASRFTWDPACCFKKQFQPFVKNTSHIQCHKTFSEYSAKQALNIKIPFMMIYLQHMQGLQLGQGGLKLALAV